MNYFVQRFSNCKSFRTSPITLKSPAFSLAEILIVLGVIGIIATLVMPNFITDYKRSLLIIKLQRGYALAVNGFDRAISENGSPDTWGLVGEGDPAGLTNINDVLSKYFKMSKNCNTDPGCFPEVTYKNLKGFDNSTVLNDDPLYTKFRLMDGTPMGVTQWNSDCSLRWGNTLQLQNVCGLVVMDVNGAKSPNTYGEDFFGFALTKYGVVPLGSPMQNHYPFNGFCNRNSNANFKYENGLSCTAWVLTKRNMDYLDCQGLNWHGKKRCK